jgi:hypothetical protein
MSGYHLNNAIYKLMKVEQVNSAPSIFANI